MTLKARMEFGDNITGKYQKAYRLVSTNHGVHRDFSNYVPLGGVRAKDITVTLVAADCEDFYLHSWYMSGEKRSGRLCFDIQDIRNGSVLTRSIPFEEAQCVSFCETYDSSRNKRRQITISFTPAKVKIESNVFSRSEAAISDTSETPDDDGDVDMEKYNSQYDF